MADAMVLKTQQWLNNMYRGTTGYYDKDIPETGKTGWTTIYALIRALQIELGITNTADSFGPTTIAKFNERFPNGIQQQSSNDETGSNIYSIIQGALWCKGYSTGASGITTHFYGGTGGAIQQLKVDAGCNNTTSTVTLNVMKALLSMDQFVKVSGGTDKIRQIQQMLNRDYESYIGLCPCDGLYGRQMNKALIKVLQAIEGYSVADATGNFGSGTKANLPIIPTNGIMNQIKEAKATYLVKFALCCNGYDIDISTSVWNNELTTIISRFQSDICINKTGICDVDTWMSLLLSKGNPDRSCIACDTRFEITDEVATYLKNNGYQVVGRYLTGGDFKELRANEVHRILNAGLKLFLIFQESTTDLSYFTQARGIQDAKNAVIAARKYGIPGDNFIYFAVDTDPTDYDISTYILPYFKAISENIDVKYKVGIYGTRNVCTQVINAGYAETCFVSDMSTGFSGNMGFKMPTNWNFDQFAEISNIAIGNNTIDLDKVAYSNRYPVVTNIYSNISDYNNYIAQLEDLYRTYKTEETGSCTPQDILLGVTNFLRSFNYGDNIWYVVTLREIDNEFIEYVRTESNLLYNSLREYAATINNTTKALHDNFGGYIDIGHLAATIEGYLYPNLVDDYWFGWGGDLSTLMLDVDEEFSKESNTKTYVELARKLLGANSSFGYADVCTDADAIYIANRIRNNMTYRPLSAAISYYYYSDAETRMSNYLTDLNLTSSTNLETIMSVIDSKMGSSMTGAVINNILGKNPSNEVYMACLQAFAEYILENI